MLRLLLLFSPKVPSLVMEMSKTILNHALLIEQSHKSVIQGTPTVKLFVLSNAYTYSFPISVCIHFKRILCKRYRYVIL